VSFAVTDAVPLRHNTHNEVTGSVDRVTTADGRSVVRKRLRRPGADPAADPRWRASDDRTTYLWWCREAEVYADDELRTALLAAGLSLPPATVEETAGGATLWIDWIDGRTDGALTTADYRTLATALGRWQARGVPAALPAWASRGYLRAYESTQLRHVERIGALALLDDDEAWRHPLIADLWPAGLRGRWIALVADRDRLHRIMTALPRTLCHLDVWAANVVANDHIALVDWAFAGDGAIGEDIGNAIPDACFDLFYPADQVRDLDTVMTTSYLEGLATAGCDVEPSLVRLGITASCVKYTWLLPLLLHRAADPEHKAYFQTVDPEPRYRATGQVFALLTDWHAETQTL
jgi:hypothetical protein